MKVGIHKSVPAGVVTAPPSKSVAHRMVLCAALSEGVSVIKNIALSDDIAATLECITSFGAAYSHHNGILKVTGVGADRLFFQKPLDCRECGSTIRFFTPLCMISKSGGTLTGSARLMERPLALYEQICADNSIPYEREGLTIKVGGGMRGGTFTVPGNVSSQYISGLLFALPLLEGDSRIILTGRVESRPYIDLTLSVQRLFGISNSWTGNDTLYIKGGCRYRCANAENEGDWSNAAFLFALRNFGFDVEVNGVNENSLQGDKVCKEIFCALKKEKGTFDLSDRPDLAPILFAYAAANHGAVFTGTKRLRIKESDRAAAMAEELLKFGCRIVVNENSVIVPGGGIHPPKDVLYGHNDHRIVMSLAVLCVLTGGVIEGAEAVKKSYPGFFEDLRKLKVYCTDET